MASERVPLFPLNLVCFPGMRVPLRVFEPRYHAMLDHLLADGRDPVFAIALTDDPEVGVDAEPRAVGCLTRILQASPHAPQRLVLAEGTTRCRIDAVHRDRPYAEADVTILPEVEGRDGSAVARRIVRDFGACLADADVDVADLPREPCTLSYLIAQAVPLPLGFRQRLLEADDAATRLALEARALENLATRLRLEALARRADLN